MLSEKLKPKIYKLIISLAALIVSILLLEAGMRVYFFINPQRIDNGSDISAELGWANESNFYDKGIVKGYGEVEISITKFGFRVFGDTDTTKTKIFVIGDSYTLARMVSDGSTYYDYLKKNSENVEMFAYATGGYGSLQEYMIIDKYYDLIRPDMILWQFCGNDFIDNEPELEAVSVYNDFMVRPYYIDNKIQYLFSVRAAKWKCELIRRSYLLKFLQIKLNVLMARPGKNFILTEHPAFQKSIVTTSKILGLLRKRVGNIPIILFSTDTAYADIIADICATHNIHFIRGVPEAIERAKNGGTMVDGTPYDVYHWNAAGHAIVGRAILDYLIKEKFLPQ
ncbi:MAG: SGNH/GDSL hydrolase family protein [Candidatus Omnitrophica bacterium]|nr:SGNH/GDSL hydrolase family protein [Candidatus Omnitrophota bacterium]